MNIAKTNNHTTCQMKTTKMILEGKNITPTNANITRGMNYPTEEVQEDLLTMTSMSIPKA